MPEDGKTQLISNNVRDMIEMSFWVLKFLGDFEKQYEKNYRSGEIIDRSGEEEDELGRVYSKGKIFGDNARSFIKLMRYVAKFVGTFDKYKKKNSS